MAWNSRNQPYDIILAGAFGVGKSTLFKQLSSEVHADHLYTTTTTTGTAAGTRDNRGQLQPRTTTASSQHLDKWTHSALVLGDSVKVCVCWAG